MNKKVAKEFLRKEISFAIGTREKITREVICSRAENYFARQQENRRKEVDPALKEEIINSICDDFLGLGPIQKLMDDPEITEIMVNGHNKVFVERKGKKVLSDVKFDDQQHLKYTIGKIVDASGRRVDESSPYVDFSLEDGSRVNVVLPPLAVDGVVITIRKFLKTIDSLEDLEKLGTMNEPMRKFLIACVKAKKNILFSGATGSGKTTTLELCSSHIDSSERIITIEDALELNLHQNHVVRLLTRPPNIEGKGEISPRQLFRNTLRMRPTRIILGEIRGREAMDYLQALNSGHRGSLAIIHASDPTDTLARLETMALYAGLNLPIWIVRKQISLGLDLIVQQEQLMDGSRKITYITELEDFKNDNIVLKDIFTYEVEELTEDLKVKGSFKAKNKPSFLNIFKKKGIKIDENIFK